MNNNDTNDGLNAIPLGNYESNNNDITPIPLDNNLDIGGNNFNMDNNSSNFIDNSYDIPEPINNFSTTSVFNDIGIVPPLNNEENVNNDYSNEPKKKKGMNKTLFVIIIIFALFLVGAVVYTLLNMSKNKVPVITRNVNLEMGEPVSTNIHDYASFKGVNANNCSLDTSNVADIKLGAKYTYNIVCNESTYSGTITIVDTTKPDVKTKSVTVGVNGSVSPESFIESCNDNSKCFYKFKNEKKVYDYLKTPESYHVNIIVSDEAKNEIEVTVELIVSENVATLYLVCSKELDGYVLTNKFGIIDSAFNKYTARSYNFIFATKDVYNAFKNENKAKEEVTYMDKNGAPEFNDENISLILNSIVSYDDLVKEENSNIPLSFGELKSFYQNKGFTCKIGK